MSKTVEDLFYGGNGIYENLEKSRKYLNLEGEFTMVRDSFYRVEDEAFNVELDELLEIYSAMAMEQAYAAFQAGIHACFELISESLPDHKKTPD